MTRYKNRKIKWADLDPVKPWEEYMKRFEFVVMIAVIVFVFGTDTGINWMFGG